MGWVDLVGAQAVWEGRVLSEYSMPDPKCGTDLQCWRERGEDFGEAESRAGRPLWEKISGILSQLRAGRAKEVLCQAGLG